MTAMTTIIDHDRYTRCISASKRVRWDIDRDVIRGRRFDPKDKEGLSDRDSDATADDDTGSESDSDADEGGDSDPKSADESDEKPDGSSSEQCEETERKAGEENDEENSGQKDDPLSLLRAAAVAFSCDLTGQELRFGNTTRLCDLTTSDALLRPPRSV